MKILTALALSCLISLFCVISTSIVSYADTDQVRRVIKALPINPLKVMMEWKLIKILLIDSSGAIVTMGNPKMEWVEELKKDPHGQPTPEGSMTSAVDVSLFIDESGSVGVKAFAFLDPLGIIEHYIYDATTRTFIRHPYFAQRLI